MDELIEAPEFVSLVSSAHRRHALASRAAAVHAEDCWGRGAEAAAEWERCCSSLRAEPFGGSGCGSPACCAMGNRSRVHLRLPAIREISVRVLLPAGRELRIEQDGFLRPFDLPTVLWPAGYLLAQWAGDEANCAAWAGRPVLELGAGTGAASVAAAACGARALATDREGRALALAAANGAPPLHAHAAQLCTPRYCSGGDTCVHAVSPPLQAR